jgi:multidrug transporter EmrE-like cation transporter
MMEEEIVNLWLEIIIIVLIGTCGNLLFKMGTDGFGELSFQSFITKEFFEKAFTSKFGWIIFGSLIINFLSRVLIMSPLSKGKYGITWSLLTPLGILFSMISGYIIFHETYTYREMLGVAMAIFSVWLMGGVSL